MSLKNSLVTRAVEAGRKQVANQEREMAAQLTAQYDKATGGMREVLRFGCMMMMLRAHLAQRGQGGAVPNVGTALPRGSSAKNDGGMKGWLEKNAPTIARQTAQRFEDVAKAVAAQYQLPVTVAKQLTFEQLVTTPEKQLDPTKQKAQAALFDFVAGTSQKSWLDQFRPAKSLGGARHATCPFCGGRLKSKKQEVCPHCEKKMADYDPNDPAMIARDLWLPHLSFLEDDGIERRSWKDLPGDELDRLKAIHLDLGRALKGKS